jgi:hypothetical protein
VPEYQSRVVRRCLVNKLEGQETEDRKHRFYDFYDSAGQFLAQTHISQGRHAIHDGLISEMAKQLHVRARDFRLAIDCTLSREQFYELMRG